MLRVGFALPDRGAGLEIDFTVPSPGVTALFGASGAGKSSVMQVVAGLLRPAGCVVRLGGVALEGVAPERRRVGYVFQEGRLFPHLRVAGNLRYGARRAPAGPVRFDEVVELLGLGALLERRPATLSGGERQRVAIGRALLCQPRLLLMDEPLASLDQARRLEILPFLARVLAALQIPVLYASHSLDEVMRLADHVVLLEAGRVRAAGPVGEMVSQVNLPLAGRTDAAGVLLGRVCAHDQARGLSEIACGGQVVRVPLVAGALGAQVRLLVPAREVILALGAPGEISVNNMLAAEVAAVGEVAAEHAALVSLAVGDGFLLARVTQDAVRRLDLVAGKRVLALIKAMSVELQVE